MPPDEPAAEPAESIREEPLDGPEDDLLLPSFSDMIDRQQLSVFSQEKESVKTETKESLGKIKSFYFLLILFRRIVYIIYCFINFSKCHPRHSVITQYAHPVITWFLGKKLNIEPIQ